jgi:M6 family metalloprotease-like protein
MVCLSFSVGLALAQSSPLGSPTKGESVRAAHVRALSNSVLQLHAQVQENAASAGAVHGQAAMVLAQRAAALQALIEEDPHAALSFAFSPELLADLAEKFPEAASLLEAQGSWQGTLNVTVSDDMQHLHSVTTTQLKSGTQKFELHFADREPSGLTSGQSLVVTGVNLGSKLAVSSSTARTGNFAYETSGSGTTTTSASTSGANSATTGAQNIAVILVTFPSVALPANLTPQSLQQIFFATTGQSVNGYLQEVSYGQTSATGDVFGPFELGGDYSSCNTVQLEDDAVAASVAAGANFNNYTQVFVIFPDTLSCGWNGLAQIGSSSTTFSSGTFTISSSFLTAATSASSQLTGGGMQVATHELGHNFGLRHAQARDFGTEALGPIGAAGTLYEYGNEFSTMGNWTPGHYAAPHKAEVLNWMSQGTDYQVVQSSGSYTLGPLEAGGGSLKALKVQRGTGNSGYYLWIEYRQPIGSYDTTFYTQQPYSGAFINYEDPTTGAYTQLLDFTPESDVSNGEGSDFGDPALVAGKTWTDPYSDLSLTVTGATSSGLSVSVGYSGVATCTHADPTLILTPLNPSLFPGQSASYSATLTNNDMAACASSTFTLSSTAPSGWSTSFSQSGITLPPGQTTSFTMSKGAPSGTLPGVYAINLSATNNSLAQAATANATVMTQPSLAASVSISGTSFSRPGAVPIVAAVSNGGAPTSGASVTFTVTTPNGSVSTQNATTGSNGTATWNYKLSSRSAAGAYNVVVKAGLSSGSKKNASVQSVSSNTLTFNVQ